MNEWHDFFVSSAGAAAALAGLIFVGISISLSKILNTPSLPNRAFIALTLLLTILVVSLMRLIPHQSLHIFGLVSLLVSVICWVIVAILDIRIFKTREPQFKLLYSLTMLLNQIAATPYLIGAILLLNGLECGMIWIAVSIIFSFIKAVLDAWVLLIEINR